MEEPSLPGIEENAVSLELFHEAGEVASELLVVQHRSGEPPAGVEAAEQAVHRMQGEAQLVEGGVELLQHRVDLLHRAGELAHPIGDVAESLARAFRSFAHRADRYGGLVEQRVDPRRGRSQAPRGIAQVGQDRPQVGEGLRSEDLLVDAHEEFVDAGNGAPDFVEDFRGALQGLDRAVGEVVDGLGSIGAHGLIRVVVASRTLLGWRDADVGVAHEPAGPDFYRGPSGDPFLCGDTQGDRESGEFLAELGIARDVADFQSAESHRRALADARSVAHDHGQVIVFAEALVHVPEFEGEPGHEGEADEDKNPHPELVVLAAAFHAVGVVSTRSERGKSLRTRSETKALPFPKPPALADLVDGHYRAKDGRRQCLCTPTSRAVGWVQSAPSPRPMNDLRPLHREAAPSLRRTESENPKGAASERPTNPVPTEAPDSAASLRKIVHVDMDCFFAAVELRERPELRGRPVAVGGSSGRGVLTTCNYEARAYGCRSAMPVFKARELCPQLVLLPVRFELYRAESVRIREIFARFTTLVEPLSLDEAYLDLSHLRSEGPVLAEEIRTRIRAETGLTASAGIAPNKFLAKIASDWRKPDGQFEIRPQEVEAFLAPLPVERIWGVGKATAARLRAVGIGTCGELRERSEIELVQRFGKFGSELHRLARGIDERPVNPHRERKSLSNETTFRENLTSPEEGLERLDPLVAELAEDFAARHSEREIRECVVKLKFEDFQTTTAQRASDRVDLELMRDLLAEAWSRSEGRSVRLIGAGVRFRPEEDGDKLQMEMF